MANHLLRDIKAGLWKTVRTKEVRPFVWLYYVSLWIWGIYGTFFAAPVTYVEPVMGHAAYDGWIWLNLVGTSIVMCGLSIEKKSPEVAFQLQAGGHGCMFFVLLAFEVSAIAATNWGQGSQTYSIFVIAPYVVGCLLLTAQGVVNMADSDSGGER
jgi:hypothetical protein